MKKKELFTKEKLRQNQKRMAEAINEPDDAIVNRKSKDSVFVNLFAQPEYLIQLYHVLHPEDHETEAADLTTVTLGSLMLQKQYNDLGQEIYLKMKIHALMSQ